MISLSSERIMLKHIRTIGQTLLHFPNLFNLAWMYKGTKTMNPGIIKFALIIIFDIEHLSKLISTMQSSW
jgi:hypothetical protein